MPREPVTIANGTSPASRKRSPALRAAARTAANPAPGEGSKSRMSRSGLRGSSARESQAWGVTMFWPARYTSVAASPPTTWTSEPPRFATFVRPIQSGKWPGTDFM